MAPFDISMMMKSNRLPPLSVNRSQKGGSVSYRSHTQINGETSQDF